MEVELIMIDEISMVTLKLFYQMHWRLIEILNLPILAFAGRSVLVVGDFYQLSPVHTMSLYACSLNADHAGSYIPNNLRRMFSFTELTEVMRQMGQSIL